MPLIKLLNLVQIGLVCSFFCDHWYTRWNLLHKISMLTLSNEKCPYLSPSQLWLPGLELFSHPRCQSSSCGQPRSYNCKFHTLYIQSQYWFQLNYQLQIEVLTSGLNWDSVQWIDFFGWKTPAHCLEASVKKKLPKQYYTWELIDSLFSWNGADTV